MEHFFLFLRFFDYKVRSYIETKTNRSCSAYKKAKLYLLSLFYEMKPKPEEFLRFSQVRDAKMGQFFFFRLFNYKVIQDQMSFFEISHTSQFNFPNDILLPWKRPRIFPQKGNVEWIYSKYILICKLKKSLGFFCSWHQIFRLRPYCCHLLLYCHRWHPFFFLPKCYHFFSQKL